MMIQFNGAVKSIFNKNRSLGETSTKFGTNDVQDVLSKKSTLSSKKTPRWPLVFKMAASSNAK